MNSANDVRIVQVFAGTTWQAQLVKGLLDANGVPCMIKDETISAVTSPYATIEGEVLVVVSEEYEAQALKVIEENTIPETIETQE
ncbi:MAG: DUF2007 domain-containing protein [Bacteroidaceae bacterium]|nr:DUF2007 domain-containing protein [Bacteroidaceae bacterium]